MNRRSVRFRLTVWYASLLAGLLILYGASVYLGLGRYLRWALEESLSREARQIGETLLANVDRSGEEYVIEEIKEHYAPEINGRFLRVTRTDGSVLYASGRPEDKSFDPALLSIPAEPVDGAREEHLSDESELLIYTLPFTTGEGRRFLIETGAPYGQIEGALRGLLLTLVLVLPVLVAAAIGGGYFLMAHALTPLDRMARSAELITSRNLNERLPVIHTGDELEQLSISLNRMIARLDKAFEQISRFSADASHELRTPLTVLRGELEAAVQQADLSPQLRDTIGSALEEVDRLTKIVESLLTISRLDAGEAVMERTRVDVAELAAVTVEQMRLLAEDKNISLRCDLAGGAEVEGDRARLKQVVVNLLDNAIKYTPEGGAVQVRVSAGNGRAVLEIIDNGIGIPAESLPHIFERFYRADKARSRQMGGAGLGLSIVNSICAAHGGRLKAHSGERQGSRFRVEFPLTDGVPEKKG